MSVATLRAFFARALAAAGRVADALLVATVAVWLLWAAPPWPALALALVGLLVLLRVAAARDRRAGLVPVDVDALEAVRADARRAGGGAFIGLDLQVGGVVHAPAEAAVLVIGPPRRGKSTSVVIPTVLTAPGPVVSTSTKPDVLLATAAARSRLGSQWAFDPTGLADLPEGVGRLRWSPLDAATEWASARRIAAAMVGASPAAKGTRQALQATAAGTSAQALQAPVPPPGGRGVEVVGAGPLEGGRGAGGGICEADARVWCLFCVQHTDGSSGAMGCIAGGGR